MDDNYDPSQALNLLPPEETPVADSDRALSTIAVAPPDHQRALDTLAPQNIDTSETASEPYVPIDQRGVPSPAQTLIASTLGPPAAAVNAMGSVVSGIGKGLGAAQDYLSGQSTGPKLANPWLRNPTGTLIEKGSALEKGIFSTPLEKSLSFLSGQGWPSFTPNMQEILAGTGGRPLQPGPVTQQGAQGELARDLGTITEPTEDLSLVLNPFGKTTAGLNAEKNMLLESNLGKAAEAGQKNLLTFGPTGTGLVPKVINDPLMKFLGKGQTMLRNQFPGYFPTTETPAFNKMKEALVNSPRSYANYVAENELAPAINDVISRNAQQMGIQHNTLMDIMTSERENPTEVTKGLPLEVQDEITRQRMINMAMAEATGKTPNANYLFHAPTEQFDDWIKNNFPQTPPTAGGATPKSLANPSDIADRIPGTLQDINQGFQEGRGDEFMKNPETGEPTPFAQQFKNFKGQPFIEDLPTIEAKRYLNHIHEMTAQDLLTQAGRQFGKTGSDLGLEAGSQAAYVKGWGRVPSEVFNEANGFPGANGAMWFPKDIADHLNGVNMQVPRFQNAMANMLLNKTGKATKLFNYGILPKSGLKNYFSNLFLSYLNGQFSPKHIAMAAPLAWKANFPNGWFKGKFMNLGPLSDEGTFLHHPELGDLSEKATWDLLQQNRAVGMGPYRANFEAGTKPQGMIYNNPYSKGLYALHNFAEDASRAPVALNQLEKGASPARAGEVSRQTLYDYSNMGGSDIRNAQLMPFYRFMRLNTPNMFSKMVTQPAQFFAPEKLREMYNQARNPNDQSDEQAANEWQRESEPWFVYRDQKGQPQYMMGSTFNPTTDINSFFGLMGPKTTATDVAKTAAESMWNRVNPIIKTVVNEALNFDTNYNKPIVAPGAEGTQERVIPGLPPMSPRIAYALKQFRPISEIAQPMNPNSDITDWERGLRALTGINIQPLDTQNAQKFEGIGGRKDIENYRKLIQSYGRQAEAADQRGDKEGAALARQNMQQVIENLRRSQQ